MRLSEGKQAAADGGSEDAKLGPPNRLAVSLAVLLVLSTLLNLFLVSPVSDETREATKAWLLERQTSEWSLLAPSRRLAAASTDSHSEVATNSTYEEHEEHGHQHDALIFLMVSFVIGAGIMQLHSRFAWAQETVVLFVLGMLFALIIEGFNWEDDFGQLGTSYKMWMDIDPHLLLFTMLPPLLAGDAMCIDTSVAQHVGWQCLYLAGPGVLFNAFAVGGFIKLYLDWEFKLCMVTGSILCATDPVAVVALLKQLGASPTLTVQIQGESLLNDGTAIVLFLVSYNMLSGRDYDYADIIDFLVRTAMMACALGMFLGYVFLFLIRASSNPFNHRSSMIQISLSLCSAYWSFVLAEGIFGISGVLATVSSSMVLARHMWPHIISQESMHSVWHTFESLGNVIIFFLAGAICGGAMLEIKAIAYLHLIVLYLVLLFSRGLLIFASRPVLRWLSVNKIPVSVEDAIVMTWGGLRGAVGLALAIQVHNDRAPDVDDETILHISVEQSKEVMFYVAGIAFLTTIINATTCPALVKWLGITSLPQAQLRLLKMLAQQLANWSLKHGNPPEVTTIMTHMLEDLEDDIDHQQGGRLEKKKAKGVMMREQSCDLSPKISGKFEDRPKQHMLGPPKSATSSWVSWVTGSTTAFNAELENIEANQSIIEKLRRGEDKYRALKESNQQSMLWVTNTGGSVSKGIPADNLLLQVDEMVKLIDDNEIDLGMAQVVNRAFLSLVNVHYWKQIECRDLRPGSEEAKILLTSIQVALSSLTIDLRDFPFVIRRLRKVSDEEGHWWQVFPEAEEAQQMQRSSSSARVADADNLEGIQARQQACLGRMVASAPFSIVMALAIVANCVYVLVEDEARTSDNSDHLIWLIIEASFTSLWLFEFLLKFWVMRWTYFHSSASVFDFVLVVLGLFGLVVSVLEHSSGETSEVADLAGVMRISRVFRVLRFLRIFRLFHARLSADKAVSVELANHMLRIDTLSSFIAAHLSSQQALIKYFGGNGAIDTAEEAEIARCIVQSQVYVYQAIQMAFEEEKKLSDEDLLQDLKWTYERKEITESLEEFVIAAYKDGAISAREAESIVHPLHHQIVECLRKLNDSAEGIKRSKVEPDRYLQGKNAQSTPVNSRSQIVRRASVARGNVTMDENGEVIVLDPVPPPAAEKPQVMCMETEVHDSAHESTPDTSGDVIPVEAAHLRSNSSQEESSLSPPVLIGEPLN